MHIRSFLVFSLSLLPAYFAVLIRTTKKKKRKKWDEFEKNRDLFFFITRHVKYFKNKWTTTKFMHIYWHRAHKKTKR